LYTGAFSFVVFVKTMKKTACKNIAHAMSGSRRLAGIVEPHIHRQRANRRRDVQQSDAVVDQRRRGIMERFMLVSASVL
jgi:hypothetical protein